MNGPVADSGRAFWTIADNLIPDLVLPPGDERYVETAEARGRFSFRDFFVQLGFDPDTLELMAPQSQQYILFVGHRGSGKSTELRRQVELLDRADRYLVVLLDATEELDVNNLQFVDVLFSCAGALCEKLDQRGVAIDAIYLQRLRDWFQERVISRLQEKSLALDIKAEVEAGVSLPLLAKLLFKLSDAFKYNTSYKDELRQTVRDGYSGFAKTFNQLIEAAGDALRQSGLGRGVLFVIDGTDRMRGEDTIRFFVEDVHQLQLVRASFVYCAPIHILSDNTLLQHRYSYIHRMPMIKLREREGTRLDAACQVMRELVYRRVGRELFDDEATVDYLVDHSGGHPRDLVRLLAMTRLEAGRIPLDRAAAQRAVERMAVDFKRILEPDDYALLRRIDANPDLQQNSVQVHKLLGNLAILEYNQFWWRSHPLIRTLPDYHNASV